MKESLHKIFEYMDKFNDTSNPFELQRMACPYEISQSKKTKLIYCTVKHNASNRHVSIDHKFYLW